MPQPEPEGEEDLELMNFDKSLPGFRSLQDSQFSCESDFTTLVRQMTSDIPLQRVTQFFNLVTKLEQDLNFNLWTEI